MNTGTIKFYNRLRGYGFIIPSDGGVELFFHATDIIGEKVADNDVVEYETGEGKEGIQARNVKKMASATMQADEE